MQRTKAQHYLGCLCHTFPSSFKGHCGSGGRSWGPEMWTSAIRHYLLGMTGPWHMSSQQLRPNTQDLHRIKPAEAHHGQGRGLWSSRPSWAVTGKWWLLREVKKSFSGMKGCPYFSRWPTTRTYWQHQVDSVSLKKGGEKHIFIKALNTKSDKSGTWYHGNGTFRRSCNASGTRIYTHICTCSNTRFSQHYEGGTTNILPVTEQTAKVTCSKSWSVTNRDTLLMALWSSTGIPVGRLTFLSMLRWFKHQNKQIPSCLDYTLLPMWWEQSQLKTSLILHESE